MSSETTPKIVSAEYLEGYKLRVAFDDGKEGVLDLEGHLWGEVFEPLRDVSKFKRFHVDSDLATIVWPTGADLAPEFLYQECA